MCWQCVFVVSASALPSLPSPCFRCTACSGAVCVWGALGKDAKLPVMLTARFALDLFLFVCARAQVLVADLHLHHRSSSRWIEFRRTQHMPHALWHVCGSTDARELAGSRWQHHSAPSSRSRNRERRWLGRAPRWPPR